MPAFNLPRLPSAQVLWGGLAMSVAALAGALVGEFVFHWPPCILCLAQRVPFVLAIVVAAAALAIQKFRRPAFFVLTLLFLANTGIAAYQVGIERQWWGVDKAGDSQVCTVQQTNVKNIKDLYESMSGTPMGDCARPAFNFHGLTFAVMNAVLSFLLMLASLAAIRANVSRET